MRKKIKEKLRKRFVRIWLMVLLLALVVMGARFLFISQNSPSLADVLAGDQIAPPPFDASLVVASLLALSLATMSLAKGYEIVKRNRAVSAVVLPQMGRGAGERAGGKEFDELKRGQEALLRENAELQSRLRELRSRVKDVDKVEGMLRKSNISLSRECERLKSENELLVLKINSLKVRPKKRAAGKVKAKSRSRTRSRKRKRKAAR